MIFEIRDLKTEFMENPMGMDCAAPRFSWKMMAAKKNARQSKYEILVGTQPDSDDMWNSGPVSSGESNGIYYSGKTLAPCTKYFWKVKVSDDEGQQVDSVSASFETGFLNPSMDAWDGAQWIGAPLHTVSSDVKGIFGIEAGFAIKEGCQRAGIVIGANDRRLSDRENYFRFDVDVSQIPAKLSIYRVGIVKNDSPEVPLAVVDIVDYDSEAHEPVITEENKYKGHVIDIQITGNCEYTSIDGKRVDVTMRPLPWGGEAEAPRQINPLGNNDVNTFPRLNEIGFYVPAGQTAAFEYIKVRHLRKPYGVFFSEDAANGICEACTGRTGSIFAEALEDGRMVSAQIPVEDGVKTFYIIEAGDKDTMVTGNPSHTSIPMLRRSFQVADKPVKSARLYATARGIYECSVNGISVTDTWFNPGETQYDRHLMYQTYDLGHCIQPGENAIGVILSSGWWSDAQTFVLGNYNYFGDKESFLGKLVVTYEDGSSDVIVTDTKNWKYCGDGPFTYAGFFHGEHYNAVVAEKFEGFDRAGFDDNDWQAPVVITPVAIGDGEVQGAGPMQWPYVNQQEPELIGQVGGGVYAIGEFQAKSVTKIRPGVYIYDMGYNIAGVPKLKLHGVRGQQAVIRFAEILCPSLPEFEGREGTLMIENLRDADCTDLYIFRGDENGEEYMPRFTFRGYRYIEISGVKQMPQLTDVCTVQLSSLKELSGNIRVSNPMVNDFIDNVRRSQRANFISIPTDCPQRNERMGWDGDTSIFSRTASFNTDVRLFYYRWLQAMRDLQVNGKYPDIAPVGGGFGGYTYESSGLHVTWEVYQQYGDIQVVRDNYEAMAAFMDYSAANKAAGHLVTPGTLGDWLSPEETDLELICLAFYGYNARIMSKMAAAIGKEVDAAKYGELFTALKAEFNERFIDKESGKTKDDTQCSYALPLSCGMINDEFIDRVGNNLAEKTKRTDYRVLTGFFGTAPLNPMLTATGHMEDAYRLMEQTLCPSWLYPVTQGATSIWERWDSYTVENGFGGNNNMNSFNHYSLGAVCEWLYMYVLGIRRDEDRPGYKHFTAKPEIGSFEFARGGFETPYGRIQAEWEKKDGEVLYRLEVPANCSATVVLPDGRCEDVGSGAHEFAIK